MKVAGVVIICASAIAGPLEAAPWEPSQRVGIGFHLGAVSMADVDDSESEVELKGAGVHLRVRVTARWEVEVSAAHFKGEHVRDIYVRDSSPIAVGLLLHLTPNANLDWYGVLAVGTSKELVTLPDDTEQAYQLDQIALGGGLQTRVDRLALGLEGRLVAHKRTTDPPETRPITPEESIGAQFTLTATYYF